MMDPPNRSIPLSWKKPSLRAQRSNPVTTDVPLVLDCFVAALLAKTSLETIPSYGTLGNSEPRRPARDGDDAGARHVDEAQRLHQVDEGVELLGRAGHLENEALDRRIDDPGTENVGQPQGFDALLAGARHLDERQLALDMGALVGQVAHDVDGHQARELRLDLLDDHARARGHDGDARQAILGVDLGHGQALDVVAAARKQSDDARQDARLIVHQHRDGVLLDVAHDSFRSGRGLTRLDQDHALFRYRPARLLALVRRP